MSSFLPGFGSDEKAIMAAMHRSQAIIQFDLDGIILDANANFCGAMGYELSEIVGQHHRMFVDPKEVASADYVEFWARLKRGEYDKRQYKRFAKGGREIWIEASYNPIFRSGKPYKVVKFATDITEVKRKAAEDSAKLEAVSRSQAVIEFKPNGEIITANANFCAGLGYDLSEIVGKHHRMFCDPAYVKSDEYARFWQKLAEGQFTSNEFQRFGKGGKEIWIQAAYNPIFDLNGKVYKVVKYATDVTERMSAVASLGSGLMALADGNLLHRIDVPFVPTMEKVRQDFNDAVAKLRGAMQDVAQNAQAIASGSTEMQVAASELARRTEQQAAAVEQTAAAVAGITTTVADSARQAEQARTAVSHTRQNAEHSGTIVRNAITAMGQIENSSREIANIISVIDEIAFQTNLLALNAGVEAARAGDAGKGFAVVAQEVRGLAQSSANAAREIKALINNSSEQVKSGVSLVGQTGTALEEILKQVQNIGTNVDSIADSAKSQAATLREINQAVGSIDQGTQHNAAMVEETTAASHGLASEADAMFRLIGMFQVQAGGIGSQGAANRAAPRRSANAA
jgi:methyl-accepting chemotaxis protein